jgi:hypothetical protein
MGTASRVTLGCNLWHQSVRISTSVLILPHCRMLQSLRLTRCGLSGHTEQGGTRIERPFSTDPRASRCRRQSVQSDCTHGARDFDRSSAGQLFTGVLAGQTSLALPYMYMQKHDTAGTVLIYRSGPHCSECGMQALRC